MYNNDKCVWEDLCKFSLTNTIKKGKRLIGIVFNTDPHTGEVFKAKSGYEAPYSDMPAVDVTPQMQAQRDSGGGTFDIRNSNAQGQGVDWQKVDTGRRQRAANTAKYGLTDRESNRFQRQQARAKRKRLRQQKRDTRRRERQLRRRNEGGFLRRLFK